MADYVIREEAIKAVQEWFDTDGLNLDNLVDAVKMLPGTYIAPMVHGRWISAYPDIEPNPMFGYGICSRCGFEQSISDKLNYCPNCFAKMDMGKERK